MTTGIHLIICSESMGRLQARQLLENQIWLKPQRQPQSRVARPFVISSPPGYLITSPWRRNFPTDNCLERPITPTIWHFKYNKRSHFCCFQVPALQHPRMVLGLQPPVDGRDQRVQWAQGGRSLHPFFSVFFSETLNYYTLCWWWYTQMITVWYFQFNGWSSTGPLNKPQPDGILKADGWEQIIFFGWNTYIIT